MKKVFCCLFLVIILSGIISLTIYTLKNKGIREVPQTEIKNKIEKVTSNVSNNSLTEMYNVYFNNLKHRVKMEYSVVKEDDIYSLYLVVYFDGKSILTGYVASSKELTTIEEYLNDENIDGFVRLDASNIMLITEQDCEYMVLHVGFFDNVLKEKYFIFDNEGNSLVEPGILVVDLANYFLSSDDQELDIFYDDEYQKLAKIEDNIFYALEPIQKNKNWIINEYKYVFKEGKLEREIINIYENIKLKVKDNN